MAGKVRIVRVEARTDELGMGAVLGEDDGLAEPVAVLDLDPVRHQVLEHAVDGVGVEQPLVERRRIDGARNGAAVVPFQRVPRLLLLVGELVVADAAVEEVGGERDRLGRHQEAVLHRLVEAIGVGRHAGLQIEQPVGVAVDLALRRRGQADQQAVEVFEDRLVLAVDRAMRLVDHHEVEVPDAEAALLRVRLVDQAHHGRIGRDVDAAFLRACPPAGSRSRRRAGAS